MEMSEVTDDQWEIVADMHGRGNSTADIAEACDLPVALVKEMIKVIRRGNVSEP